MRPSFRGVVDNQVHAGGGFQSPDVAALAADDATLHVFAGQGYGGHCLLAHIIPGIALDGAGDDFLGLAIGRFFGFGFDNAHHTRRLMAGARFNFLEQAIFGLLGGQPGHFLQAAFLLVQAASQFLGLFLQLALLAGLFLFLGQDVVFLLGHAFHFFLQALAHILEFFLAAFQFALLFLVFIFHFSLLVEQFVLTLDKNFLFLGLGLFTGFFHDALGQIIGVADAFVAEMALKPEAEPRAAENGEDDADGKKENADHAASPGYVDGLKPDMLFSTRVGNV